VPIQIQRFAGTRFAYPGRNGQAELKMETVAQTGNTYISENMTDSIEIPTANLGFTTT